MNLVTWLGHLISPPFCVACHTFLTERYPFCPTCESAIEPVISCEVKVTPQRKLKVLAVGEYTGALRGLIMAKQSGNRLASRQLGQVMARRVLYDWQQCDYIVPVPLHWLRYAERGFNQSYEIAKVLGQEHTIPVSTGVQRVRATAYQASLGPHERKENVQGVFGLASGAQELYRGKHLVIVDDVMTTGSTLIEMVKILATCRPASITAVVAARVILK